MPRATLSTEPEQFALQSCDGGWVKLRRMTYGERLHRQDIAMTMSMQADVRTRQSNMEIKQAQTQVAAYELRTCVVAHNLEDSEGNLLDFKSPFVLDQLDGRIGDEIAGYIEQMHDWTNTLPNSSEKSDGSSSPMVKVSPGGKKTIASTVE